MSNSVSINKVEENRFLQLFSTKQKGELTDLEKKVTACFDKYAHLLVLGCFVGVARLIYGGVKVLYFTVKNSLIDQADEKRYNDCIKICDGVQQVCRAWLEIVPVPFIREVVLEEIDHRLVRTPIIDEAYALAADGKRKEAIEKIKNIPENIYAPCISLSSITDRWCAAQTVVNMLEYNNCNNRVAGFCELCNRQPNEGGFLDTGLPRIQPKSGLYPQAQEDE